MGILMESETNSSTDQYPWGLTTAGHAIGRSDILKLRPVFKAASLWVFKGTAISMKSLMLLGAVPVRGLAKAKGELGSASERKALPQLDAEFGLLLSAPCISRPGGALPAQPTPRRLSSWAQTSTSDPCARNASTSCRTAAPGTPCRSPATP